MLTASDLYTYTACPRWTYLDFHGDRRRRLAPSEFTEKLLRDGRHYEREVLGRVDSHRIEYDRRDLESAVTRTREALADGLPRISGAVLAERDASGHIVRFGVADLLERVPGRSALGDFHYEPVEIKTARRVKRLYRLQVAFYGELLAGAQGTWPKRGHLILGDGRRESFPLSSVRSHYQRLLPRIEEIAAGYEPPIHVCSQCTTCPWRGVCLPQAERDGHLSLVYGLQRACAAALAERGVRTFVDLAGIEASQVAAWTGTTQGAAEDMVGQARALAGKAVVWRQTPALARAEHEMFFDIEGDPDHDALYLFGVLLRGPEGARYHAILAERPEHERQAFLDCLGFFESHPEAPIYHYHQYENSALSRLVERYGVDPGRVAAVRARMVDLSTVLVQSCYLPVTSYSLKSVARFLGFEWSQSGSSAVQAVVWFSTWLRTGDRAYLERAIDYNDDDCRATQVLKDWLAGRGLPVAAEPRLEVRREVAVTAAPGAE